MRRSLCPDQPCGRVPRAAAVENGAAKARHRERWRVASLTDRARCWAERVGVRPHGAVPPFLLAQIVRVEVAMLFSWVSTASARTSRKQLSRSRGPLVIVGHAPEPAHMPSKSPHKGRCAIFALASYARTGLAEMRQPSHH